MKYLLFFLVNFFVLQSYAKVESIEGNAEFIKLIKEDLLSLDAITGQKLIPKERFIKIVLRDFDSDDLLDENLCNDSTQKIYARVIHTPNRSRIEFSHKFLKLVLNNHQSFACKHGSFRQFFRATLWHELAHVLDQEKNLSADKEFLALIGARKENKHGNYAYEASHDAYEFKNPKESFAVNLEWFLLDPEFACRKPATYDFFVLKLGFRPHPVNCEQNFNVLLASAFVQDHFTEYRSLNPNRIYAVHYLFAGRGKQMMSRWGHAMLRLIICAPHRKVVDEECMQDISHHLVISYRASIENAQMNYLSGIGGEYPSIMFIYRMQEIMQEYNKQELRELWSVPLKLDQEQLRRLILLAVERHWSYQGKYFFFNNNCGSETYRHLVAVEESKFIKASAFTPRKLFKDLVLSEKFDKTEPREILIQKGYYFPSKEEELERSFHFIKNYRVTKAQNFKHFLSQEAADRLRAYQQFNWPILKKRERNLLILNIQMLERYMASLFQVNLTKSLPKHFKKYPDLEQIIQEEFKSMVYLREKPWSILAEGYGVPRLNDFEERFKQYEETRQMKDPLMGDNLLKRLLSHPSLKKEKIYVDTYLAISEFLIKKMSSP